MNGKSSRTRASSSSRLVSHLHFEHVINLIISFIADVPVELSEEDPDKVWDVKRILKEKVSGGVMTGSRKLLTANGFYRALNTSSTGKVRIRKLEDPGNRPGF